MKQFQVNTEIIFGEGALDYLLTIKAGSVLIVCDPFIEKSGMVKEITERLTQCEVCLFSEVTPDPSLELIAKGVEVLRATNPKVLIAIGGGSAIDAAKAMYEFALRLDGIEIQLDEFIALPTTSGTGSEVTSFAVVTDTDNQIKIPLTSNDMVPSVAILSPELTASVPPAITADTGMDVITHSIEAIVSQNATDCTDAFAEKALMLAFEYLPQAFKEGNDMVAREKMHNASCLAGLAFNQTGLGINHSLAHAIGGKWHIPHGRTNAILLPYVIEFNAQIVGYGKQDYSCAAIRYQRIARHLGLRAHSAPIALSSLVKAIRALNETLGIPQTFAKAGISREELAMEAESVAETALADICTATNPRAVNKAQLKEVFSSACSASTF